MLLMIQFKVKAKFGKQVFITMHPTVSQYSFDETIGKMNENNYLIL